MCHFRRHAFSPFPGSVKYVARPICLQQDSLSIACHSLLMKRRKQTLKRYIIYLIDYGASIYTELLNVSHPSSLCFNSTSSKKSSVSGLPNQIGCSFMNPHDPLLPTPFHPPVTHLRLTSESSDNVMISEECLFSLQRTLSS
ncbi:hypothetical protein CapIbe_013272 [Capra ibex]